MSCWLEQHHQGACFAFRLLVSTKDSVFTVGNDRMLKELEAPDLQVAKELQAGTTLGQLVLAPSKRILFAATSEAGKPGCVRAYSFPLTGDFSEVNISKPCRPQCRSIHLYT